MFCQVVQKHCSCKMAAERVWRDEKSESPYFYRHVGALRLSQIMLMSIWKKADMSDDKHPVALLNRILLLILEIANSKAITGQETVAAGGWSNILATAHVLALADC